MVKTEIRKINTQYESRINCVLDYIEKHIEKTFTLTELAEVSGFSPFHFSRVFSGVMDETLFGYITRLKLEKAKGWLWSVPQKSITDIALDFGFNDSSEFARAFKRTYGISASRYRKQSKQSKEQNEASLYNEENSFSRSEAMDLAYNVETKKIEEMSVMYLRHVGTYAGLAKKFHPMMMKLFAYAQKHTLLNDSTKLIAVYHDNPNITADEKRRTSVCLTIPAGTKIEGEFGQMTLDGGLYAIGHFSLDNGAQETAAWQLMFGEWLPNSGYQPGDGPVFEAYLNNPKTHPQKKHLIDIYLPIKEL